MEYTLQDYSVLSPKDLELAQVRAKLEHLVTKVPYFTETPQTVEFHALAQRLFYPLIA